MNAKVFSPLTHSLIRSVSKRLEPTFNPFDTFCAASLAPVKSGSIALALLSLIAFPATHLIAQSPDATVTTETSNQPALPHLIKYSGTLTDGRGYPITAPIEVTFSLYHQPASVTGSSNAAIWQETQRVTPNEKGVYTVYLGAGSPQGLPTAAFTSVTAQYLGVKLEGEAELPRTLLVSVPYALKAGDAQTLGGLPASAYARVNTQISTTGSNGGSTSPDASTSVTTTGGISGYLPEFSSANTVVDSPLFINSSRVGIGTTAPSATLQVNGTAAFGATSLGGALKLNSVGAASTTTGEPSQQQVFQASSYDSSVHEAVPQTFAWQALPLGNNTTNAGGALSLLSGTGTAAPTATGLAIQKNGVVSFVPGQTFPGTGKGSITGVTAGTDLVGGGTSGNVTLSLNTSKLITGVTAGSGLTGGGTAGAVTLALDTTKIPTLTDNPTFTGTITANSKTAGKPAVAANGTNGGYGVVATSDKSYAGLFSTASIAGPAVYTTNKASTDGYAYYASVTGTDGTGLYSDAVGAGGYGIYSVASGGSDSSGIVPVGVYGVTLANNGIGVEGNSTADGFGVAGKAVSGVGVSGSSQSGEGIYGTANTGIAGYFQNASVYNASMEAYNSASVDGSGNIPVASYGLAYGTGAVGVGGYSYAGIGVRGFAAGVSNLGNRFEGDGVLAGVWGDIGTGGGYPYLAGVLGSADNDPAGYFQNDSSTYATVSAYNAAGGTGLFKTFEASSPEGTCGIGGGALTCTGQVKSLAISSDGSKTLETYSMQSPENWMEDFGTGAVSHGFATIIIDSTFVSTANTGADYHVFLTPNGDSKGLYVVAKTANSFEVHESSSGTSTLSFDYRIVAKRRGFEAQRLVDVTERFSAETESMKKRMQLVQANSKAPAIKMPARPQERLTGATRSLAAPQQLTPPSAVPTHKSKSNGGE